MKIAILYTGYPGGKIKNVRCDKEVIDASFKNHQEMFPDGDKYAFLWKCKFSEYAAQLFECKEYKIANQIQFDVSGGCCGGGIIRSARKVAFDMLSKSYAAYEGFKLIQASGIKYDLVFITRIDFILNKVIDVDVYDLNAFNVFPFAGRVFDTTNEDGIAASVKWEKERAERLSMMDDENYPSTDFKRNFAVPYNDFLIVANMELAAHYCNHHLHLKTLPPELYMGHHWTQDTLIRQYPVNNLGFHYINVMKLTRHYLSGRVADAVVKGQDITRHPVGKRHITPAVAFWKDKYFKLLAEFDAIKAK